MGEQEIIRLSGRGLKWYPIRTSKLFDRDERVSKELDHVKIKQRKSEVDGSMMR